MTRFIQAWKLYPQLPMKHSSTLPDEGFPPRPIVLASSPDGEPLTFMVYCTSKAEKALTEKGPRGARVIVHCKCGKHVPFGRMGQHYGRSQCWAAENGKKKDSA